MFWCILVRTVYLLLHVHALNSKLLSHLSTTDSTTSLCLRRLYKLQVGIRAGGRKQTQNRRLVLLQVSQTPGWESVASSQSTRNHIKNRQRVKVWLLVRYHKASAGGMLWALRPTDGTSQEEEAVQRPEDPRGRFFFSLRGHAESEGTDTCWGLKAQQRAGQPGHSFTESFLSLSLCSTQGSVLQLF